MRHPICQKKMAPYHCSCSNGMPSAAHRGATNSIAAADRAVHNADVGLQFRRVKKM